MIFGKMCHLICLYLFQCIECNNEKQIAEIKKFNNHIMNISPKRKTIKVKNISLTIRNDIEYLFASVGKILLLSFENDNEAIVEHIKAMAAVTAIAYYDDFKNLSVDYNL